MEIDNQYPEKVENISENCFLNFYFLNVDISLNIQDPTFKFYICIKNITVEGAVSQILYIGPGSFSIKIIKIIKDLYGTLPVF